VSSTQLRPLGVGEILDVAIKAYSTNARTLITIGAIVGIPFQLLSGLIELSTVSSADQVNGLFALHTGTTDVHYSQARVAGLVVTALIGSVVTLVVTAAMLKAVSDAYLGNLPGVGDSLRFAARRIGSLFWLYLLLGLGLTVGYIALIVPGIWLYGAWSVATPVLLVEGLGGSAALRRSFRLVRRRWWSTAFTVLVATLMASIGSGVVVGAFLVIPHAADGSSILLAVIGSTIASSIAVALVQPFKAAVITVLYFDLRVRRDGLDLALLATGLGLPELADAPPGRGIAPIAPIAPVEPAADAPPAWPSPPGWDESAPPDSSGRPAP
jgi:hypothetical protein